MKKSDVQILLVLLGIAILVLGYIFAYKKVKDKIDSTEDECVTLRSQLAELEEKAKMKDQLIAETAEYNKMFEKELTKYPATLDQEAAVVFFKGVEEELKKYDDGATSGYLHTNIGLQKTVDFYVLGQGAPAATAQQGVGVGPQATEESQDYVCTSVSYPITYEGTYEGFKKYLEYIATYKYFMNISSVTCARSFDQTTNKEVYSGSVTLNAYCVSGPNRTADPVNVDVPNGVGNIFTGGGTVSPSNSTGKYDADQGDSLATNHDLSIGLVKADNDTTGAGVIVAADPDKEETIVSFEGNETATLDISIYEKDSKNYVTYKIGDKQYEAEILSSDYKIFVASTARVDANDLSGVTVNITNSTSIPVYIKVKGDDTTSPRFVIGQKTGSVTVY
ncbi:MAG: hypothetical protein K6C35_07505 [Eubacterium sp.]|nr:hypothetical protein [Eubacterium sp.]